MGIDLHYYLKQSADASSGRYETFGNIRRVVYLSEDISEKERGNLLRLISEEEGIREIVHEPFQETLPKESIDKLPMYRARPNLLGWVRDSGLEDDKEFRHESKYDRLMREQNEVGTRRVFMRGGTILSGIDGKPMRRGFVSETPEDIDIKTMSAIQIIRRWAQAVEEFNATWGRQND